MNIESAEIQYKYILLLQFSREKNVSCGGAWVRCCHIFWNGKIWLLILFTTDIHTLRLLTLNPFWTLSLAMSDEFSFTVQEYIKVDSSEQHQLRTLIAEEHKHIDSTCKTKTEKEKDRRELKEKLVDESSVLEDLNEKLTSLGGNQYTDQVCRDGVLCCSDLYGLVYIAKKRDLYIAPISCLDVKSRGDLKPVRSFASDIMHISLSESELFVCVGLADHIDIFEASILQQNVRAPQLTLKYISVSLFLFASFLSVALCRTHSSTVGFFLWRI